MHIKSVMLKILAILQILGGSMGLLANAMTFSVSPQITFMILLPLAITSAFYVIFVIAGMWLWSMQKSGIILSIAAQVLQLISFSSPTMLYKFIGGMGLSIIMRFPSGDISFAIDLGSKWASDFFNPQLPPELGLNIIAVVFLLFLLRMKSSMIIAH